MLYIKSYNEFEGINKEVGIMKKRIIISIVAIVLVAGIVVGLLFLFKKPTTSTADETKITKLSPDLSVDYGACKLLDKTTITPALGNIADNLQGPDNMGRVHILNGDESQICVYGFEKGGTIEDSFNIANSFNVEVYTHKNQASLSLAKESIVPGQQTVKDVGESAVFYSINSDLDNKVTYTLVVYIDLRHYSYTINVPKDSLAFTEESALTALQSIAATARYE